MIGRRESDAVKYLTDEWSAGTASVESRQSVKPRVIDIGAAITQPMVDEYREATEARLAGRTSRRLTVAFWTCLILIGLAGLVGVGLAVF